MLRTQMSSDHLLCAATNYLEVAPWCNLPVSCLPKEAKSRNGLCFYTKFDPAAALFEYESIGDSVTGYARAGGGMYVEKDMDAFLCIRNVKHQRMLRNAIRIAGCPRSEEGGQPWKLGFRQRLVAPGSLGVTAFRILMRKWHEKARVTWERWQLCVAHAIQSGNDRWLLRLLWFMGRRLAIRPRGLLGPDGECA